MPAAGLPCPSPLFGGFSLIADETRVRAACESAWRLLASRSWPRRCDNYIFMDRIAGWPCARCFHYRRVIAWSNPSLPLAVHSRVYSDLIERRPLELKRTCNSLHLATWPLLFIYVIRLSLNYSAVSCGLRLIWMSKLNYIDTGRKKVSDSLLRLNEKGIACREHASHGMILRFGDDSFLSRTRISCSPRADAATLPTKRGSWHFQDVFHYA